MEMTVRMPANYNLMTEDEMTYTTGGADAGSVAALISGGISLPCPEYEAFGTKGSLRVFGDVMHLKYLDPAYPLPDPVADPGTPGQTFGATGTFASSQPLRWIEEDWKREGEDLSVIWTAMYENYRNGVPYPITMDEALAVIEVIDKVKRGTPFERKPR